MVQNLNKNLAQLAETHNKKQVLFFAYLKKIESQLLDIAHILALPVNQPQKNLVSEEFTLSPLNIKRARYFLLTANLDVTQPFSIQAFGTNFLQQASLLPTQISNLIPNNSKNQYLQQLFKVPVMNAQFFKKKQQASYQFCNCSLTSTGGVNGHKVEKFLARLQTQSAKPKIQVNMSTKLVGHNKKKQTKQSLKPKEKKGESIRKIVDKGFCTSNREDRQIVPTFNYNLPIARDHYQTTIGQARNRTLRNQHTFIKQMHFRQEASQIKVDAKLQNNYKKPLTQRSTQCSNANQLKNSIEMLPSKLNEHHLVNNTTISVIQQKEVGQAHFLPRSKCFSLNLRRKERVGDNSNLIYQRKQNFKNNNLPAEQNKQINIIPSLKLNDLMFKSVESFQQGSSDQYSILANENQYHSNPVINQNNWSQSLNQIFVKKMRRMSQNTNQ